MSRLIIKNLPAYLDEARLKEHFSSQGAVITDSKLARRPDGTSRRFGFVGFKTEGDAQEALQYFNRTFIDTARIDVSIAKAIVEEAEHKEGILQRRKERQQTGGSAVATVVEASKKGPPEEKKKIKSAKGVSFDEFMAIMAPKKKRKTWQNEEGEDGEQKLNRGDFDAVEGKEKKKSKREKREEYDGAKANGTSDKAENDRDEEDALEQDAVVHDEGLTDLEYMYKRMKRKVGEDLEEQDKKFEQSDSEGDDDDEEKEEEDANDKTTDSDTEDVDEEEVKKQDRERADLEEKARKDQENVDAIMSNGRLFVRNLPFDATEEDLENYFAKSGEVTQTHITLDKKTKTSKGIGFVTFANPSQALAAYRSSDGSTFQGRLLHIMPAIQLRPNEKEGGSVKDKKRQELKAGASRDFNWSTLFMNSDAVASSVASRLGVEKSEILNPDEEAGSKNMSPAVRLALAETSVIQETKEYLEKEGINVEAFQGNNAKRSETVTLVKNIPFGTSAETLRDLFEKFGKVERVVMPPSGTIAIVEMEVRGDSKVAFKSLAYKRLGNSVLYLEKAPLGILVDTPTAKFAPAKTTTAAADADDRKSDSAALEASATLFIKNLAFSTTDERLNSMFSNLNDFVFARIQRRKSKNGAVNLSMGYGFVGFRTTEAARAAQKAIDKTTLDGHLLSVSFAKRGQDSDDVAASTDKSDGPAPTTKLVIKNLPFQASKKDVRALFAAHGKVKSVRVPRKSAASISSAGGGATGVRGFGFVEFVNRKEAENAYKSLKNSHLLGRHLVLEWDMQGLASQEDQLDNLRKKTARGLTDVGIRKEKLHLNEEDIRAAVQKEKELAEHDDDEDDDEVSKDEET
ncbi:hypothetical protein CBS101457_002356 [Exobasidium rhododendri]|nr:hypothetical protein CBS101457_002356 [Exobasidium rhododendri]